MERAALEFLCELTMVRCTSDIHAGANIKHWIILAALAAICGVGAAAQNRTVRSIS